MVSSLAQRSYASSGEHTSGEHILAFDFSASRGSLCLWQGASLRASKQATAMELSAKAEILPRAIDSMLRRCAVAYADLRAICFVRGPGSYTGLRASLAVAKGLRLAHASSPHPSYSHLATYSLTSFEAALLAMQAKDSETKDALTLALVESFHDIWYAQAFRANAALGKPQALADGKLAQLVVRLLANGRGEPLFLCGAKAQDAFNMLVQKKVDEEVDGNLDGKLEKKLDAKFNHSKKNLRDNLRDLLRVNGRDSKAEYFSRPLAEKLATGGRGVAKGANAQQGNAQQGNAQQEIKYASGAKALLPLYIGSGV